MNYITFFTFCLLPLSLMLVDAVWAARIHIKGQRCTKYPGYAPGGYLPEIKPISSPIASFDNKALKASKAAPKFIGKSSALLMHSIKLADTMLKDDNVKKFGKIAGKLARSFKSIAPMLGPTLGIVSSIMGFIPGLNGPSPQDILNKVSKYCNYKQDLMSEPGGEGHFLIKVTEDLTLRPLPEAVQKCKLLPTVDIKFHF